MQLDLALIEDCYLVLMKLSVTTQYGNAINIVFYLAKQVDSIDTCIVLSHPVYRRGFLVDRWYMNAIVQCMSFIVYCTVPYNC